MKKAAKLVVTVTLLSIVMCIPVFASNPPSTEEKGQFLVKKSNAVAAAVDDLYKFAPDQASIAALKAHEAVVAGQVDAFDKMSADNYVLYLKRVVVNKQETLRIKQQNVNAMADVVKVNPDFAPQLEAAKAELAAAQADVAQAQLDVINAQAHFAGLSGNNPF